MRVFAVVVVFLVWRAHGMSHPDIVGPSLRIHVFQIRENSTVKTHLRFIILRYYIVNVGKFYTSRIPRSNDFVYYYSILWFKDCIVLPFRMYFDSKLSQFIISQFHNRTIHTTILLNLDTQNSILVGSNSVRFSRKILRHRTNLYRYPSFERLEKNHEPPFRCF